LKYGVSIRTIQRRLDKVFVSQRFYKPKECVVIIYTTYFGCGLGVMVFKDTEGHHLYRKFIKNNTITENFAGVRHLEIQGIRIKGIVGDGRKGLFRALQDYTVQMCRYPQEAIVMRYFR